MSPHSMYYAVAIVAPVVLLGVVYSVFVYNRLTLLQNQVRESWSGVDVQLKRRHDLIPNLVECVKGYSAHEHNLLELIARNRAQAQSSHGVAAISAAETGLTQNLRSILAAAEAYPDLKADRMFRQLGEALIGVEESLQYARRYYNGSVRDLNNLVQSFPSLLVARSLRFSPASYFEVETSTERATPEIKL